MSDILQNIQMAASLWLWRRRQSVIWDGRYSASAVVGVTAPHQFFTRYSLDVQTTSGVTATFIGVDANGIGYFHLTNIQVLMNVPNYLFTQYNNIGGGYTGAAAFGNGTNDNAHVACIVTDTSSTLAPIDSHVILPPGGYPVVGCVSTVVGGNTQWYAFCAGSSVALTVASAAAACNSGGYIQGGGDCANIDVTITGLT